MHSAVESMLEKYNCKSNFDYIHALKEIIQEITLLGLYRSGFYSKAAFYGETALRIFHGLERFSEDLDFTLTKKNENFDFSSFLKFVKAELESFGFELDIETKTKLKNTNIKSAFIKGGTLIHLLKINSVTPPVSGVHPDEKIKVKFEIDIDPPEGATTEMKYHLIPIPFTVQLYTLPSLFSGKLHAVLCRNWQNRIKGRDLYDLVWYISRGTKVNLDHLHHRMIQSGHLQIDDKFNSTTLVDKLMERICSIDFNQAKLDVLPFIKNPDSVELWSKDFFISIIKDHAFIPSP